MAPGDDHGHAHGRAQDRSRLRLVLLVTLSVAVVELVGAFVSGSLALFADGGYMFIGSAAVIVALIQRRRAAGVCGYLAYAGVTRLLDPVGVDAPNVTRGDPRTSLPCPGQ